MKRTASIREGLKLTIPDGALGRSITGDALLRWMPTTEAVILQDHDLAYAMCVFCDVLFDAAELMAKLFMNLLV
jgi:hypothetical protein